MNEKDTLIDNEYATLWYYPNDQIIHHIFHQPICDTEFRSVLRTGLELMNQHGANKWLSDDRNNSILNAEDSAWVQDHWLPLALKAGWKYWAVLPPTKARGRISMERIIEFVGNAEQVVIQIFSGPEMAWQWLRDRDITD